MLAGGNPTNTLLWLLPGPSQEPSALLHKHRGTRAGGNPYQGLRGRDTLSQPLQSCPRRVSVPVSRHENHHDESILEYLSDCWGLLPRGVEHNMGQRGREFWDCTGLIMGCLGEEPKARKEMDLGDLGRNECGKIEGSGDQKSWT